MSTNVVHIADAARPMTAGEVHQFLAEHPLRVAGTVVLWGDRADQLLAITTDPIRAALAADEVVRREFGAEGLLEVCHNAVRVEGPDPVELLERRGRPVSWRLVPRQSARTVLACRIFAAPTDGAR
jgi:hypothetical protein